MFHQQGVAAGVCLRGFLEQMGARKTGVYIGWEKGLHAQERARKSKCKYLYNASILVREWCYSSNGKEKERTCGKG